MTETTPRQLLYALVSAGFLVVTAVLILGASGAGLVPSWWTATAGAAWSMVVVWSVFRWRRTIPMLAVSIGLLIVWVIVTLLVARS
jgi:hypothetical protein